MLETLLTLAFLAGVSLMAGYYIGPEEQTGVFLRGVGWFCLFLFFGLTIVAVLRARRELKRQRRYERAKKGLVR